MRKTGLLLIVVLATILLATSCSQGIRKDGLCTVKFSRAQAKDLFVSVEYKDVYSLTWTVQAEKLDDGTKTGEGTVEDALLTDTFGPYSTGSWRFTLSGYDDADKLVYLGVKEAYLRDGANTVEVVVEPQGSEGTISFVDCNYSVKDEYGDVQSFTAYIDGTMAGPLQGDAADAKGYKHIPTTEFARSAGIHSIRLVSNGTKQYVAREFKVRVVNGLKTIVTFGVFEGDVTFSVTVNEQDGLVLDE